jgi:DNA-binding response OmpR family regulator
VLRNEECRVLVVEDQDSVRRLIALWLSENGFVALEASNGSEGLNCLRRHSQGIDLVIIDVVGTHGLDLAAEMGLDYRATPILYISGHIDTLAVQAIGWRSPESLLIKPFHESMLIDRVRRLLDLPATHLKPGPRRKAPAAHDSSTAAY